MVRKRMKNKPNKSKLNDVKIEIDRQKSEYENTLFGQKERIFSLREENKKLKEELESYQKKDKQISSALVLALQKAREIEETAKIKSGLEMLRLKEFHRKWVSYYEKVQKLFPEDEKIKSAGIFLKKMQEILHIGIPSQGPEDEKTFRRELEAGKERINSALQDTKSMTLASAEAEEERILQKLKDKPEGESSSDDFFKSIEKAARGNFEEILDGENLSSLEDLCREMGLK